MRSKILPGLDTARERILAFGQWAFMTIALVYSMYMEACGEVERRREPDKGKGMKAKFSRLRLERWKKK